VSIRWPTGLGIAVGGLSGAVVALLGAFSAHEPAPAAPAKTSASSAHAAVAGPPVSAPAEAQPAPSVAEAAPSAVASAAEPAPSAAEPASSAAVAPQAPAATAVATAFGSSPALEVPTTREALLRAELYCDKRQDFDECSRAATALETGSAGPADPQQAKRFRRIALTHLVEQCETGSAHACFVIAAKYRAGVELAPSPVRAEALEKRGLELCRKGRTAPECPAS